MPAGASGLRRRAPLIGLLSIVVAALALALLFSYRSAPTSQAPAPSTGSRDPGGVAQPERVIPPVEIAPQDRVYFFTTKGESARQERLVINHQDQPFGIVRVTSSNPVFQGQTQVLEAGRRYNLTITVGPDAPAGRHEGIVTIATNSPAHPSIPIRVAARIDEIVSATPGSVTFGSIRFEQLHEKVISEKVILVRKHQGSEFRVLEATIDLPFVDLAIAPQKAGESYLITARIVKGRAKRGDLSGSLRIKTNDREFPELNLSVSGRIL